jgi:hypothetical protein
LNPICPPSLELSRAPNVIVFSDIPIELDPTVNEPVINTFWLSVLTNEAVLANELDIVVVANEAVPKSEPVIPAVTINDPVTLDDPSEKNPFFILNSFGISFPYPR